MTDVKGKGEQRIYGTTFDTFNRLQVDGGYKSLYRGFTISGITVIPQTLIMMPLFDFLGP